MDFAEIELGPRMQALPERERKFVWFYLTNEGPPNGAQAARDAGYSDSSEGAKVRAHALLHRERVILALEEVGKQAFRGLLGPAVKAAAQLIQNEKHADHSKAVFTTLARLGLGEKSSVDVNVSGEVSVNHTDAALNDLRTLLGLGVAREKLIEIFGFSGLSRYEKMLAEADARAGKLIEHRTDEVTNG
jgi:phage terminase small subunit